MKLINGLNNWACFFYGRNCEGFSFFPTSFIDFYDDSGDLVQLTYGSLNLAINWDSFLRSLVDRPVEGFKQSLNR